MRRCTHHGRRVCLWCIATTFSFPIEHFIWERAPLFRGVTALLGL
jgi:hypothetical protein